MTVATPTERVIDARDRYLRDNGFSVEEYSSPSFRLGSGRFHVTLPNPRQRRATVGLHDLHHVATGLGSGVVDEMLVSAWEVGAGLGGLWVAWVICVPAFVGGLVIAPRRAWDTFRRGRRCRSLFAERTPYPELLDLSVADLRRRLGLPVEGLSSRAA
jgi:hypothetical protein